jgi:hypothetical protein
MSALGDPRTRAGMAAAADESARRNEETAARLRADGNYAHADDYAHAAERARARARELRNTGPVCATCGMPVARDYSGWTHRLPPMAATDRRRYRHVVRVTS